MLEICIKLKQIKISVISQYIDVKDTREDVDKKWLRYKETIMKAARKVCGYIRRWDIIKKERRCEIKKLKKG